MRNKCGLLMICVFGMLALGAMSASAAPKAQTFSLLEVDSVFVPINGFPTSNASPAVGQGFVTGGEMYKWVGGKKGAPVGHVRVVCTVTSVNLTSTGGSAWTQCEVSLFLPGGVIEASGPLNLTAGSDEVPIVGGTDAYVGAQGYVNHKEIGGQNSNSAVNIFHITN